MAGGRKAGRFPWGPPVSLGWWDFVPGTGPGPLPSAPGPHPRWGLAGMCHHRPVCGMLNWGIVKFNPRREMSIHPAPVLTGCVGPHECS